LHDQVTTDIYQGKTTLQNNEPSAKQEAMTHTRKTLFVPDGSNEKNRLLKRRRLHVIGQTLRRATRKSDLKTTAVKPVRHQQKP